MIIAIHQPNYIPWLGYFDKINKADKFVFLDDAKMTGTSQHNFINRNKIKGPNGAIVLTVPISSHAARINECRLANQAFKKQHFKSFYYNYLKSKYFGEYEGELKEIYEKEYSFLSQLNIAIIKWICKKMEFKTEFYLSSELGIETKKDERIVDICKKLKCSTYLSGSGGKEYNRNEIYEAAGIKLVYQEFKCPTYSQLYGEFIPNLSALDYLFNAGADEARNFFRNNKKQKSL